MSGLDPLDVRSEGLRPRISGGAVRPKAAVGMTNCLQSACSSNSTPVVPTDQTILAPFNGDVCALSDRHSKYDVRVWHCW